MKQNANFLGSSFPAFGESSRKLGLKLSGMVVATIFAGSPAHAGCLALQNLGNFILTETFPWTTPPEGTSCADLGIFSPGDTFYSRGDLETLTWGPGRYVVSKPSSLGLVTGVNNYSRLEFTGFDAVLGKSAGVWNYNNYGSWQVADDYRLISAGDGVRFSNFGTVLKTGPGSSWVDVNFHNSGLVQISAGNLIFTNNFVSSGGRVEMSSGTHLVLEGTTSTLGSLSGGSVSSFAGIANINTGTISDTILDGRFALPAAQSLTLVGTITNKGTLTIGGGVTGVWTPVYLSDNTILAGSGTTVLGGRDVVIHGAKLTVGEGHTLRGSGNLGSSGYSYLFGGIENRGTILVEGSDGIHIDTYSGPILNKGRIGIASGSFVEWSGQLEGGVIEGNGTARLKGGTLRDVTLEGALAVPAAQSLTLVGTITNKGTLTIGGGVAGVWTPVYLPDNTTLAGSGTTVLGGRDVVIHGAKLTVGEGHTLRGSGNLGSSGYSYLYGGIENRGTILVDGAGGMGIDTYAGSFVNLSTVKVTSALTIKNAPTDNRSGVIDVEGTGSISVSSLRGGIVRGEAGARILGGSFADVTTDGSFNMVGGNGFGFSGTITNKGTLTIGGGVTGVWTPVYLSDNTILAGSGTTVLGGRDVVIHGAKLTVGEGHTLRGSGNLGSSGYSYLFGGIENRGTILVEGSDGIHIDTYSGPILNKGRIGIASGSFVEWSGQLEGGVIEGNGTARLKGGTLRDVTLEGALAVPAAQSLTLVGTITNKGTLTIGGGVAGVWTPVYLPDNTTLAGSGTTVLGGRDVVIHGAKLTVGEGHTLRGSGNLGSSGYSYLYGGIENRGTILVDGAGGMGINTYGAPVTNKGAIVISAGTILDSSFQSIVQNDSKAILDVDGELRVSQLRLEAGVLKGTGTVVGDVVSLGGEISPGHSPGEMDVMGALTLGKDSHLLIDVNGNRPGVDFDWLRVSGDVLLGGELTLHLGFLPAPGYKFRFLTSERGKIFGSFNEVMVSGYLFNIEYGDSEISLTVTGLAPVPEPESYAMLAIGLAVLAAKRRQRGQLAGRAEGAIRWGGIDEPAPIAGRVAEQGMRDPAAGPSGRGAMRARSGARQC